MKKLFFLIALLGCLSLTAQTDVEVINNSSVDVEVRIHRYDGLCTYVTFDVQTIPANGGSFTFNAAPGEEYTYLDFASSPGLCSPGFSGTLGTPSTPGCPGNCSYPGSADYLGSTNGCGTQTFVSARWTNCGPVGGLVIISDF